jgi:hypothetical protein
MHPYPRYWFRTDLRAFSIDGVDISTIGLEDLRSRIVSHNADLLVPLLLTFVR